MSSVSLGARVGAVLILIGTSIGAGMLALPLSSAVISFPVTLILLFLAWFIMTATGLYMLELIIALPAHRNHFDSMARQTLGGWGQVVAWISSLCLFYALIAAYISGNASLIVLGAEQWFGVHLPVWLSAVLFLCVISGVVFYSTRGVDLLNRGLMSFKGLMLLLVFIGLVPHMEPGRLWHWQGILHGRAGWLGLMSAAPIFLFGFGYHAVLPSLVNYLGPDIRLLRRIVIVGTTVALCAYVIWLGISFGLMPAEGSHSLMSLHAHHASVDTFLLNLQSVVPTPWVKWSLSAFMDVAMATSCLGVSLGLFDFLADGFKHENNTRGRLQTAAVTFLPPLMVTLWIPKFFRLGLQLGAIFVVVLEIFLPILMVYMFRRHKTSTSYRVAGGRGLLYLVGVLGLFFLLCDLITRLWG